MKTILNLRLHPAVIISSVFFWALVVVAVYFAIMLYCFTKIFGDNVVRADEAVGTFLVSKINGRIYKKKVKPFLSKNKPFSKL